MQTDFSNTHGSAPQADAPEGTPGVAIDDAADDTADDTAAPASVDSPGRTPEESSAPTGFGRRRRRLSDEETARRMLETAAASLTESGLTVSLEHLRLEDVIRDAGVSRSAVYRRWPHKDLFLADLLVLLAQSHHQLSPVSSQRATATVRDKVLQNLEQMGTENGRLQVLTDLLRVLVLEDFQESYASDQWRTYLALTVTVISLPQGRLRTQVQQALTESEALLTEQVATSYRTVAELFGMRLRPRMQTTYGTLARLGTATIRGLIVQAFASPEVVDERVTGSLFGREGEWSLPALGLIGTITTYLEPDPDVEWSADAIEDLRQRLESTEDLFSGGGAHPEPPSR